MRNSLETRLGIFFALVVVAAFLLFELAGGLPIFNRGITLFTEFNSIGDLKPGDPVKMGGVPVGRVQGVHLTGTKVQVELGMNKDVVVKTDSKASVRFTGLMGQNFVALDFGSEKAPAAENKTTLQSKEQPDLAAIMSKLDAAADGMQNMSKSFSGEEFSKLLGPLSDMVKDSQPKISAILGNLQNITTAIDNGSGTVGKLIKDDSLYTMAYSVVTNINASTGDLKGMIADAKGMLASVNRGEGTLGKLVKDEKLYSETTTFMTNMKEISEKINKGQGTVGKLVNDESMLKNIKLTLQKVENATEGLEDTGPLSVIGTVAGRLF
ncbi:MAG TPA: MlaD family protein [Candidatus Limnocylindria bacterium]|jgi:phospholipid/cholesterol/gamma-HCH transport system substrate-binding protein|nr:MlaD family protein [Candidatus Limnocylindria bacterium]